MTVLPTWLPISRFFELLFPIGIGWWRLAAVLAIKSQAVSQYGDKKQQYIKSNLECRGQILLFGNQLFCGLYACFYVDILDSHFATRVSDKVTITQVFESKIFAPGARIRRYYILCTVAYKGLFAIIPGDWQCLQRNSMDADSVCLGFSKNHLKTLSRTFFKERKFNYRLFWTDTIHFDSLECNAFTISWSSV